MLLFTPQEAYGNAKDTIVNNKVILNYLLILCRSRLLINNIYQDSIPFMT